MEEESKEGPKIRLSGRAAADSVACYEILSGAERGQIITYEELSEACKRDIQKHRGGLISARRRLEREGLVFQTLIGVGLRIMEPGEHVHAAQAAVTGIRRKAKRSLRRASHAQVSEMDMDQRVTHAAMSAVLADTARGTGRTAINTRKQQAIRTSEQVVIPSNIKKEDADT